MLFNLLLSPEFGFFKFWIFGFSGVKNAPKLHATASGAFQVTKFCFGLWKRFLCEQDCQGLGKWRNEIRCQPKLYTKDGGKKLYRKQHFVKLRKTPRTRQRIPTAHQFRP